MTAMWLNGGEASLYAESDDATCNVWCRRVYPYQYWFDPYPSRYPTWKCERLALVGRTFD
jgi:hypothetical protein